MIVDDEPANRDVLRLLLESHGEYRIVAAADGQQALAEIDVEHPDLVITDALMPGLDGYQLTQEIRQKSQCPGVPVIILSANYSEAEMLSISQSCGANVVMSKPAEPEKLFAAVDTLLSSLPAAAAVPGDAHHFPAEHLKMVADKLVATTHRLRLTEEQLQRVADAAPVGIVLTDEWGRTLYANQVMTEITGLSTEELRGEGWTACLNPPDRVAALERTRTGTSSTPSTSAPWQLSGSDRWLVAHFQTIGEGNGNYAGTIITVSDISGAMAAVEKEQDEQRRDIQNRAERDRLESLRRMASGIAHEFNNALATVLSYAEFLQETVVEDTVILTAPTGPQLLDDLSRLTAAAKRARNLAGAMLRFGSRIVSTSPPVGVNAIVRDKGLSLAVGLPDSVALCWDLGSDLPDAQATAEAIDQVLTQTVANSVDNMPGGGTILVVSEVVTVSDEVTERGLRVPLDLDAGRYVRLTVTDDGAGMPDDVLVHAIDPFFTTKVGHSGLGLFTALGAVRQIGGGISIESGPERGTSVHAYFPVGAPEPSAGPAAPAPTPTGTRTILVVDDDAALLTVIVRMLQHDGYSVLSASSGPEALAVADAHPHRIDCLLTDVVMPTMLGNELADRLTAARPQIRVLYMSGYADPMAGDRRSLAPYPMLTKPFTRADLYAALDQLVPTGAAA
ncbi:hypothetical protein GCM10010172_34370 [Paractinoplanes ferrugineus]|uniref:histidine kinase n=1 Tax=Paractinoplanes ferrugineus TaxID=113564 RepID=A0A919J6P8_9ACTN|nr:response regulator [Actinoplanes ferrugineus]GIE15490.1 hypothetical protein Afe05nite_73300 [Actinoplanes ferrugineus]